MFKYINQLAVHFYSCQQFAFYLYVIRSLGFLYIGRFMLLPITWAASSSSNQSLSKDTLHRVPNSLCICFNPEKWLLNAEVIAPTAVARQSSLRCLVAARQNGRHSKLPSRKPNAESKFCRIDVAPMRNGAPRFQRFASSPTLRPARIDSSEFAQVWRCHLL